MIIGKTEAETLKLNGWGVGDILEGDEGYGSQRILITGIGESNFLCKWDYKCNGDYEEESGCTTLTHREWKKVATVDLHNCLKLSEALRVASNYLNPGDYPTHCEHDTLHLGINPSEVTPEDEVRLVNLGFIATEEDFISFKFGSA